jgi:regulator of sigma E protease
MYVIIFIVILAILVFVHELGHFIAAKSAGIRVDEFGLGFPPRIVGIKRGETVYSINAIPFGGFVKIFGENPDEESTSGTDSPRSFVNRPKWIQAIVLVAGICFNLLFAWLLMSVGFMVGFPTPQDYVTNVSTTNSAVTITSVVPGSPADKAGLQVGDRIVSLESGSNTLTNFSVDDVRNYTASHGGEPIIISYTLGNTPGSVTVTPEKSDSSSPATIGVSLDILGTLKLPFFQAIWEGGKLTISLITETVTGLATFIGQIFTGHAQFSDVAGPVGIAGLVGDATRLGIVYLISFTAYISINLAVINLIPFPALDGGRLLFVLIEKIKGTPIKSATANAINATGFVLLILLMIVITYHDIARLIH